jgi:hypothetical protein
MLFAVLAVLVPVLVLAVITVVRDVHLDGYGTRPAPTSAHGWGVVAAPSAPFRAALDR